MKKSAKDFLVDLLSQTQPLRLRRTCAAGLVQWR